MSLFERLPPTAVQAVAARFRPRRYKKGEFVFLEGERAHSFCLLAAGRIKMIRETADGREVIVRLIEPGEIFGAAGAWGEVAYPLSAAAQEDCVVLVLPAEDVAALVRAQPEFALAVIRELGRRLHDANERIRDLQVEQVEQRLARALLRLAAKFGSRSRNGLELAVTRQDLADLTGTTLSTASRTVSAWARLGVVAAGRERITLLDPEALAGLAELPPTHGSERP